MAVEITNQVNLDFKKFKKKTLPVIEKIDLEFEIGYCIKKRNESFYDNELYTYFQMCICFLKGQLHYQGKTYNYA